MKSIALAIYSKPKANGAAETAYDLAQALLSLGHQVSRLFFFHDGVYNAIENDSRSSLPQLWSQLIQSHSIDAVVCVASAEQRGIKQSTSVENQKLLPGFAIAGLAQLIDVSKHSDHLITFSD